MEDIDHSGKANCIDSPVSIAVFIINHFQHSSTTEAFQSLGAGVLVTILRIIDRKTHDAANLVRK